MSFACSRPSQHDGSVKVVRDGSTLTFAAAASWPRGQLYPFPNFSMGAVKENLQPQEVSFEHADSCCMFDTRFVATPAALELHGAEIIGQCLQELQKLAQERNGLDYIQVFRLPRGQLWIMDSDYYVTALLPSDY